MPASCWHARKSQWLTKVRGTHHLGTMNVCTKLCANPSIRCWDISQDKWKLRPAGGARGKVRVSPVSVGFILWGPWTSARNFMAIHPVDVKIFQSGPKWLTDKQTDQHCRPLKLATMANAKRRHIRIITRNTRKVSLKTNFFPPVSQGFQRWKAKQKQPFGLLWPKLVLQQQTQNEPEKHFFSLFSQGVTNWDAPAFLWQKQERVL